MRTPNTSSTNKNKNLDQSWKRFVEGEDKYFKQIYIHYYEVLFGYGYKLCSNQCLVRDTIQDLLKSIWENRNNLSHIQSANVYLFVSLRRALLRSVKKGRAVTSIDDDYEFSDIEFCIEEIQIKNECKAEIKALVQKALNELTSRQKEIVILFYFNGMSYGEIEEILGINRQSVRNHMHRAITNLRDYLEPEKFKLVI